MIICEGLEGTPIIRPPLAQSQN